ncbi:hypothetical protein KL932_000804 [Ogataea haglerorum]|nr:hypothetical protein KL914_002248 [Ogataea haglerorum]KAG7710449.1 hypothetical protein KL950_001362 [Ogataea haglerorum]KAG7744288.1 hypothetical protein KL932_000804 [Ogataea haglerorum]KAG7812601.1 hypothetical protein KL924_001349 [Ogataea haglerorum]
MRSCVLVSGQEEHVGDSRFAATPAPQIQLPGSGRAFPIKFFIKISNRYSRSILLNTTMSRFFATAYDSEDSSDEELLSSSEELLSSSESEAGERSEQEESEEEEEDDEEWASSSDDSDDDYHAGKVRGPSYFLKKDYKSGVDDSDSDSDAEEKRVVKSAKEKYLEEIANLVDQIENFSMVEDWVKISTEFDKLNKLVSKYPQFHIPVPRLYIKSLAILEDTISSAQNKDVKKKLNALESKSMNVVKQRVKKAVKDHQSELELYRKNPEAYESGALVETDTLKETQTTQTSGSEAAGIFTILRSIIETRGKKNLDLAEQISQLEELTQLAKAPFHLISIYLLLVPIRFDLYAKAAFMPLEQWRYALRDINALLDVLEKNRDYVVSETAAPTDDIETEPQPDANGVKQMIGSIASLVERLADELTSHLLAIDPHSTEYVSRLRDESSVYTLLVRAQVYYESIISKKELQTPKGDQLARVILKRVDYIYFKPSKLIIFGENTVWKKLDESLDSSIYPKLKESGPQGVEYTNGLIDALCLVLYEQPNSVFRKKAVLYHIYYYAFNDQYFKARDMLLLSHLQATIHTADPQLQVLFNRSLVQLGLSAFRCGLIHEAQQSLYEIATSPRQKELLGQGVQRFQVQQSQVDKQRLLPFHMHVNLELLECSFYTASMLIEVPLMVQNPDFAKRRVAVSKSFKRVLEYHERQVFDGPPEYTRDYIMLAAKALLKSDWKKASELINSIKIWDLFNNSDKIKAMLLEKLQIEALRTYLFTNETFYSKLSISTLAAIFQIEERIVKSTVLKMIANEEITALYNQPANILEFVEGNKLKASKLQELALNLSEKVNQIVERNERLSLGGFQYPLEKKQNRPERANGVATKQ